MIELVKKFLGTAGVQLLSKIFAVLLSIFYARALGPESYGLYGFTLSIVTVLAVPVVSGYPNLIIREIAIYNSTMDWKKIVGIINWSRFFVIISSTILMLLSYISIITFDVKFLVVALFLIPLRGLLAQQGAILNGFKYPVLAQLPLGVVTPLLTSFGLSFFYYLGFNLNAESLILLIVLSSLMAVVFSYFLLRRYVDYQAEVPCYKNKYWFNSVIPFSFISLITVLNSEYASVFLGVFGEKQSVAYYKVAFQGVFLCTFGLSSINAVIMPQIASLLKREHVKEIQVLLTRSCRISAFVGLPIIFILIFFGDLIIGVIFGSGYLQSYEIMVILCFGQLFNVLLGPVGSVLYMTGNERAALRILFCSLTLNIVLVSIFSIQFGAVGAAVGTSISMVFSNIAMAYVVYKQTNLKTWLR
ncbi:flippase [Vibrio splendidus]